VRASIDDVSCFARAFARVVFKKILTDTSRNFRTTFTNGVFTVPAEFTDDAELRLLATGKHRMSST